jgi:hypothetical protein
MTCSGVRWLCVLMLVGCHDEDAWRRIHPEAMYPHDAPLPIDASAREAPAIDASPLAEQPDHPVPAPASPPDSCLERGASYPIETFVVAFLARDVNGDGKLDVIASDRSTETERVGVYLGAGDGTLAAPAAWTEIAGAGYTLSPGDLNADGNLDFAIANTDGKTIDLYQGAGDGTFAAKASVATARKPFGVTVADLDGDNHPDLVVETFTHVEIHRGTGPFTFKRKTIVKVGQAPDGPLVADLDGDKLNDLAYAANDESFFFTVLNQRGKFTPTQLGATCSSPAFLVSGDLDHDGDIDATYRCGEGMELQLNDGTGGFRMVKLPFGGGGRTYSLIADFTGDGHVDLLAPDSESEHTMFVLAQGDGAGGFTVREKLEVPEHESGEVTRMTMGDFNGDGRPDALVGVGNGTMPAVTMFLGRDCEH